MEGETLHPCTGPEQLPAYPPAGRLDAILTAPPWQALARACGALDASAIAELIAGRYSVPVVGSVVLVGACGTRYMAVEIDADAGILTASLWSDAGARAGHAVRFALPAYNHACGTEDLAAELRELLEWWQITECWRIAPRSPCRTTRPAA